MKMLRAKLIYVNAKLKLKILKNQFHYYTNHKVYSHKASYMSDLDMRKAISIYFIIIKTIKLIF